MAGDRFARLVELACHDLRTPLATVSGFAKTMLRSGELEPRESRFVGMIEEAAGQIGDLVDQLALAAHVASGRYAPVLGEVDTLVLASAAGDERIGVTGTGALVETSTDDAGRSLAALARAALRYGEVPAVTWTVEGRALSLAPLTAGAAPVVTGAAPRDLAALVALSVLERLGAAVAVEGDSLRVSL